MSDPLISIVLLNYNRPLLGSKVLQFLERQERKNFEVILLDNGCDISIPSEVVNNLSYPITTLKCSKKTHNKILNCAVHFVSGKLVIPFYADDDFFLPSTTKIIEEIFESDKEIENLLLGTAKIDYKTNSLKLEPENGVNYTGKLIVNSSMDVAKGYFSNWSIGQERKHPLNICGHPSATVVTKKLLEKTIAKQGEVFFGPFGDVGMLGLFFNTKNHYKIDLPLTIIGTNHAQDSSLMREYYGETQMSTGEKKSRAHWDTSFSETKHTPLKGVTHINLGTDNHIQVLIRNGVNIKMPEDLRIDFFINHLSEILRDDPWVERSEQDFEEGLVFLEQALNKFNVSNKNEIVFSFKAIKEEHIKNLNFKQKNDQPSMTIENKQSYNFDEIERTLLSLNEFIKTIVR